MCAKRDTIRDLQVRLLPALGLVQPASEGANERLRRNLAQLGNSLLSVCVRGIEKFVRNRVSQLQLFPFRFEYTLFDVSVPRDAYLRDARRRDALFRNMRYFYTPGVVEFLEAATNENIPHQ